MTKMWESEKDKLIEQMRDQYRGQQWAKSEKDSSFRSDSFDKWFDPDGVTLGEIPLTGRLFKRLGIAFGFVLAVSMGWLKAGGEIWTGYQETEVMRRGYVPSPSFSGGGWWQFALISANYSILRPRSRVALPNGE